MKYINRVARCTEDKENITKGRFYKYIYKNKLLAAKKLLTRILNRYEWSETVSDRMCRLRCFIRNYGREKVIDLVNYRREPEMVNAVSTGTDGMIDEPQRKRYTAKQRESQRYAEVLHGTLSRNSTVRKIFAIREQLGNI